MAVTFISIACLISTLSLAQNSLPPGLAPSRDLSNPLPRTAGALAKPDQAITITTTVDKAVIRVGDLIHYRMTITAPPGSQIIMPPPGAQLGEFIIRDFSSPVMEKAPERSFKERIGDWFKSVGGGNDDLTTTEFSFTITAYDTGDLMVPPLPFAVEDPDGKTHSFYTESARIRVVPFTSPEDLTIKDVKDPVAVPVKWAMLTPYVAVPLAVIAALAAGLVFWLRRRREEEEELIARPAHEVAIEALLSLERDDLLSRGEYERFYTRLSFILRRYLAGRYLFYALEFTTTEVLDALKYKDMSHSDHERVRRLLSEADLVKFARHEPEPDDRNSALERAREIVANTRPPEALETMEQAA